MLLPIPRFNTGKRLSKIVSILFLELFLLWLRRKHLRTQLDEPLFARLAHSLRLTERRADARETFFKNRGFLMVLA